MSTCATCEAELRPEWKFCIMCGTPVIPGAVRPERLETPAAKKIATFAPLIFSIACFSLAALVIAWLVLNVWS
ncbi:MAG: zinc-ribbon domain-containing protein [Rhodoglobus sp.]